MVNLKLFDFQEKAVLTLLDYATDSNSKQIITMKAPTGAGKTVILIDFIDKFIDKCSDNYAFVWLCPGKGNLEEQSHNRMNKIAPLRKTNNLFDALRNGFEYESTTFINWELITKSGNNALKPGERKNLFDRISDAERNNTKFILIIDEEHSHDTNKAADIINRFDAEHIIRVSATANKNSKAEYFEIDERDVIDAGLITKAIYVNEGISDDTRVENDYLTLLPLADQKRKEMIQLYNERGLDIKPLVLIQFPNGKIGEEYIIRVEEKLADMGYTYENGFVSKWMSGKHEDIPDNLTENNATPAFLLMKQAISTGWDCPRAKILVKLRENTSEHFTIQTIGRIRRTPEAKHYDNEVLDLSYVYTLDETFKNEMISELDKAYEVRRLFLKDKCKTFTLEKQNKDLDYEGYGEREVLVALYNHFVKKYRLSTKTKDNQSILESNKYIFGNELFSETISDKVQISEKLADSKRFIRLRSYVNTHSDGIRLLHSRDQLKKVIHIESTKLGAVLDRLFKKGVSSKYKLLSLPLDEYYSFIINNTYLLKEEFREVVAGMYDQISFAKEVHPKVTTFKMPENELYRYDTGVKKDIEYLSNAYKHYSSGFVTQEAGKSMPEILFEKYCEKNDKVDWVYKNGDKGLNYFSIVYVDSAWQQWLFYPDYIVKLKDGTVYIIETKGGETGNRDDNIDIQVKNKFKAFKKYATEKNINWGFVRPKEGELYLNNSEYTDSLKDDSWKSIEEIF